MNKLKQILFLALVAFFASLTARADLECRSLNGTWDFAFAEGKELASATAQFTATDKMVVPGCFDLMPKWYIRRGVAHYSREILLEKAVKNAYLVVEGMGLQAKFFIDGRELKTVKLPYSTFEVEMGPLAAGRHTIVCALDNNLYNTPDLLYKSFYDFYLSGGFYHGISLKLQYQATELDRVVVRTRDYKTGLVELALEAKGEMPQAVTAQVAFDAAAPTTVKFEKGRARLTVPAFKLWSPEEPNLHTVTVNSPYGTSTTRFGVREFATKGKEFILNGKPVWLKGVNRHETHPDDGYATSRTQMYRDVLLMKSIGCNFVRGAHYSQCDEFLTLCDEMGLLVWEESLGWGNKADLADKGFIEAQVEQTRLMVRNSINHPSVVISSFLNECLPDTESARSLVNLLADTIRAEDSGHLISYAALNPMTNICDEKLDFHSFNMYPAWHVNMGQAITPTSLKNVLREQFGLGIKALRARYGEGKPIVVAETGCYSLYGNRDPMGAQWSEEFQAEYLDHFLKFATEEADMSGFAVWQFCDARTYFRGTGDIRTKPMAYNMAGLFDRYRKPKLASETVKKYFEKK